ncbi:dITP/XTP pyrophosphatase [compost metagenome]
MKLVTSNANKLREFQRFGIQDLEMASVPDIREVLSDDPIQVAVYKAFDAGPCHVVEDTALHVKEAKFGTSIKWTMDTLEQYVGREAIWQTIIAAHHGNAIHVYVGTVRGHIVARTESTKEVFGFDDNFQPQGADCTLFALEQKGLKDQFSARYLAAQAFMNNAPGAVFAVSHMKPWQGMYQ